MDIVELIQIYAQAREDARAELGRRLKRWNLAAFEIDAYCEVEGFTAIGLDEGELRHLMLLLRNDQADRRAAAGAGEAFTVRSEVL